VGSIVVAACGTCVESPFDDIPDLRGSIALAPLTNVAALFRGSMSDEKEIVMEVQEGGGRRSRKRGASKRRKTQTASAEQETAVVTKEHTTPAAAAVAKPATVKAATKKPTVILAAAKNKSAKVVLVPKGATKRIQQKKTFKAKRVKVTIDNTAKTQKRRSDLIAAVDAMTEDQVRAAAVAARLSRREKVAKVPIGLLRQMVRDYKSMKGGSL